MINKKILGKILLGLFVFLLSFTFNSAVWAGVESQAINTAREGAESTQSRVVNSADYQELVARNLELREKIEAANGRYKDLQVERDSLVGHVKALQKEKERLSRTVEDLQNSAAVIPEIEAGFAQLTKELTLVKKGRQKLQKELNGAQKKIADLDKIILNEKAVLQDKKVELKEEFVPRKIKRLRDENKYLKNELKGAKRGRNAAEKELILAKKKLDKITQQIDKERADIHYNLAKLFERNEMYGAAEQEYNKYLKIKPGKKRDLSRQKIEEIERQINKEALDDHYHLAVTFDKKGMYKEAERAYLKCLKMAPRDASVHYNLGILYDDKLNNNFKARRHYKKFLELRPKGQDTDQVKIWLLNLEQEIRLGKEVR